MNVKYDLVVDFARPSKSNTIIISENDTNSRTCHFTLLNNKQPMSMSDVTAATIRAVKKDGSVIVGAADILTDEEGHPINEVEYTLPARVTDYAGTLTMTVTLLSESGEQLTSFEFYVQVRNALFNEDDMISESDLSGFRDLLNRALAAVRKVEDLSADAELPNPFPIDLEIEGVHYIYTGRDTVEVKLEHMAYIDDDPVIDTESIDQTAANVAAASAEAARQYANQARTSEDHVDTVDKRLSAAISDVNSIKATLEDSLGIAEAYGNTSRLNGLVAEGFAKGTQNGVAVDEGSPYYNNNAAYYANKKSIENRLDSANTDRSLSANMGRVLNDVKADRTEIPTQLSELAEDTDHKTVSQAEKEAWNNKLDSLRPGENITIENGVISATGGGASTWGEVAEKPFESLGTGLVVNDGVLSATGGGSTGTTDYLLLDNKPQIEGVTLTGNKSASDLGLATEEGVKDSLNQIAGYGTKAEFEAVKDSLPVGSAFDITDDNRKSDRQEIEISTGFFLEYNKNMVHLFTSTNVQASVINQYVIPESLRPKKPIQALCNDRVSWSSVLKPIVINTNGVIECDGTTYVNFSICWII